MFGPDYTAGCPSCSAIADGFDGFAVHLANHDVMLIGGVAGTAGETAGLQAADGVDVSVGVLVGGDFNVDFNVSFTAEQQRERRHRIQLPPRAGGSGRAAGGEDRSGVAIARRRAGAQIAAMTGTDVATFTRDRPGLSAFVHEDGVVYHTYSSYARGLDGLWGMYQWLDRAPKGRNETGVWWRRHDEYDMR